MAAGAVITTPETSSSRQPQVGRLIAPNISRRAADYSDEALVRLIRRGVKHDGTTAIVMPTSELGRLSDQDVAAIVSYVRSLRAAPRRGYVCPRNGDRSAISRSPPARWTSRPRSHPHIEPPVTRPTDGEGEYLVGGICRGCHELDAPHDNGFGMKTPPLRAMAKAYSLEEFRHLMRTGEGSGGRDLGLMTRIAKTGFSYFTDGEIDAVHSLSDRALSSAALRVARDQLTAWCSRPLSLPLPLRDGRLSRSSTSGERATRPAATNCS